MQEKLTGIPSYDGKTPLAVFIRCPKCFARFLVWTAQSEPSTVEPMGDYFFVDARKQSVIECRCGELLPLTDILSAEEIM